MNAREWMKARVRGGIRRLLGTGDVGSFVRVRRVALEKRFYRRPVTLAELRQDLTRLGFVPGRLVWVQSSWNEFYNVRAKPSDVVALMLELLGPEGTLAMPAFPLNADPTKVLHIDTHPSSTGLLTEIFRRTKGVQRSIHLQNSICAIGPLAGYLIKDHHLGLYPWGPETPYGRLVELNARLIGIGIGRWPTNFTPLHTVECRLEHEVPLFGRVFDGTTTYSWRRRSGEEGTQEFKRRVGQLMIARFGRHFPKGDYLYFRRGNIDMVAADAGPLIAHAIDLARRGITLYHPGSLGV